MSVIREIKYRAKDYEGYWVYGEPHLSGICPHMHCHSARAFVNIETLGQSTELFDVNEREIFEGDIVEWTFFYTAGGLQGAVEKDITLRGVIKWGTAGFIFEVWENDFENAGWYGISSLDFDSTSDIEVIGNIYDNPELVQQ